ncbi:Na/Pi cotransporter family protein [Pseudobacillus badius]|uniref:Na/Pi cotransporter family protein n=1 Tax=Bacillus badius TaxID=1455 RepID=UPI0005975E0C|nr:Na/Pi cotransporter family protein [Bacillus badius]KIL75311.1 Sodium-dependent phosphate transporter [Bacillus badius]KZN98821.1 sodium-dependent phosphate transporter [Bacillus badius]KZR60443.1 sodium-dependent phosphate transporter [Bacillus badius]MED0664738.1 Na/Pi cotransporter family protein [Bacillus badius]OCS83757.1 sodium-dependent phosphate transporter [Bacillus badius]
MGINVQEMLFQFLGGLGIFLYGIKLMGDGLQQSAGDRLRDILDRFTTNPLMGVLAGILVTVLIQSSSATTVITVGLVSAGFMTLRQAIGVIMGANIGTTVTAFIIGIDVGAYALPILALGAVFIFFFKSKKMHNMGMILFGFGSLFFGLELMSDGMKPLRSLETFHDLTVNMSSSPILGVVVGTIFTVIVQSSSATIGILQGLFSENLLDLNAALPVLFGDNIGTTITAILASIGASVAARRAAATHVLFNVIGTVIFLIILPLFTQFIHYLTGMLDLEPKMVIAFAHGTFNVTNTLIQLPFVGVLAMIVTKLIPGEDTVIEYKAKHLDPIFIEQSPSIALGQAKEEVIRMGQFAVKGMEEVQLYLKTKNQKHADTATQVEEALNNLDKKITDYLVHLSGTSLSEAELEKHNMLIDAVRDIERIGDHCENIVELIDYQQANKVKITDQAMADLEEMFALTISAVNKSVKALDENDLNLAKEVAQKEDLIDKMERKLRKQHILRMNEGLCTGQAGIVFVDIISNLERMGDHAVNIAEAILGVRDL